MKELLVNSRMQSEAVLLASTGQLKLQVHVHKLPARVIGLVQLFHC